MKENNYTLEDFINMNGVNDVASRFEVSVHTVRSWKYGNRQPSINQAKKIMRDTNLTWESIYGSIEEGVAMSNVVDIENLKYKQIKESLPRQKRLLSEEDEMFRETKEMFVELETELEKGNITETEYEDCIYQLNEVVKDINEKGSELKEYVKDCEEFVATYEERQRTESK